MHCRHSQLFHILEIERLFVFQNHRTIFYFNHKQTSEMINFMKYFAIPVLCNVDETTKQFKQLVPQVRLVPVTANEKSCLLQICKIVRLIWNPTCTANSISMLKNAVEKLQQMLLAFPSGFFSNLTCSIYVIANVRISSCIRVLSPIHACVATCW